MGLEGRSQQHRSDQAIRAGAACHSRFSASDYRYGDNVRRENILKKLNVAALARWPQSTAGRTRRSLRAHELWEQTEKPTALYSLNGSWTLLPQRHRSQRGRISHALVGTSKNRFRERPNMA